MANCTAPARRLRSAAGAEQPCTGRSGIWQFPFWTSSLGSNGARLSNHRFRWGDMSDLPKTIASKTLASWRTPTLIIGFGSLIALIAFGPRSTLGFFLTPLSNANHWGRDVFAFALALQNLLWGVGQPLGGIIADRFGSVRVLCGGGLLYSL